MVRPSGSDWLVADLRLPIERRSLGVVRERPDVGREVHSVAVAQGDRKSAASQKRSAALADGVQHRLDVGRRLRDHAQDLGRRGLLFQRFAQLGEQAHVLDGDHRLGGKGLEQLDLVAP